MGFNQKRFRAPTEADVKHGREKFKDLLRRKSYLERMEPVNKELIWVLCGSEAAEKHEMVLPDYCYNILRVFQRTWFRVLPTMAETITLDQARLAECKSLEEAKRFVNINWVHVGRVFGVIRRLQRFGELEMAEQAGQEMGSDMSVERQLEFLELFFGEHWPQAKRAELEAQGASQSPADILAGRISGLLENSTNGLSATNQHAYRWGAEAMVEFNQGMGEGMSGFMDADGEFVGGSNRANIYLFLLTVWPEIKEMQESEPRKTITDLHAWMEPMMWASVIATIDLDGLRDVCTSTLQGGIDLKLRPLASRSAGPSA